VVEDNEVNQAVARDILRRTGATVDVADDGNAAIAALNGAAGRYDVVLMDIQMPGMDGYQATRAIRGQLGLTALPIVAMTANAMEADRRKSREAGMNAHVAKPIDVDELIATLIAQAPGAIRATAAPAAALPPDQPDLPAELPGIDLRSALIRLGGDRALFVSLLGKFVEGQGDAPAEAGRLLAAGDGAAAARLLHRLRGVAANVGAVEAARLATEAEAAIKDGREAAVPDLLAALDTAMAAVAAAAAAVDHPAPGKAPPEAIAAETLREELSRLAGLLARNDMQAVDRFHELQPSLGGGAAKLARALDNLDFVAAQTCLAAIEEDLFAGGEHDLG
jgi:CheY-like chemotaxis protein